MACTKEELRRRVESTAVASNGRVQFSPDLRGDILAYLAEQLAAGRSRLEVAGELGVKGWTLSRWHQNEGRAAPAGEVAFVEVQRRKRGRPPKARTAVEGTPGFEVTCPSGFEVRVPARFDGASLRQLLHALEGR